MSPISIHYPAIAPGGWLCGGSDLGAVYPKITPTGVLTRGRRVCLNIFPEPEP